jgi:hypothetical protein
VVFVQLGGTFSFTLPLSLEQWTWCILFGLGSLIWQQIVISFH